MILVQIPAKVAEKNGFQKKKFPSKKKIGGLLVSNDGMEAIPSISQNPMSKTSGQNSRKNRLSKKTAFLSSPEGMEAILQR